jgi:hypothetical protein
MMEILRRSKSDIHFCLDLTTRDPIKVPYGNDEYWATFAQHEPALVDKFKSMVLSKAAAKPLTKIGAMSSARMQAIEDDNIRRSVDYSKRTLGL